MKNGVWFIHEGLNKYWTNYTQCFGSDEATVLVDLQDDLSNINGSLIEVSFLYSFDFELCVNYFSELSSFTENHSQNWLHSVFMYTLSGFHNNVFDQVSITQ